MTIETNMHRFDCQLYVPAKGMMRLRMPAESGPRRVARFQAVQFSDLIDPEFRNLLAAFESSTSATATVR